jgi:hypothetical protein
VLLDDLELYLGDNGPMMDGWKLASEASYRSCAIKLRNIGNTISILKGKLDVKIEP